jgi:hypothetical protein
VGAYVLCRRIVGEELAMIVSTLIAIDPIQVEVSVIARPYALGNLLCVLSFIFLLVILDSKRALYTMAGGLGYAIIVAGIGYLNPALLLVGAAHAGVVIYWIVVQGRERIGREHEAEHAKSVGRPRRLLQAVRQSLPELLPKLLLWGAACILTGLLLMPVAQYTSQVRDFSDARRSYLLAAMVYSNLPLLALLIHNSTFIVAMNLLFFGRRLVPQRPATTAEVSTKVTSSSQELLALGVLWLVAPQLVALALVYGAGQSIFLSRYLSYTTLGAAIVVAYRVGAFDSRKWRLSLTVGLGIVICFWSLSQVSRGAGLSFAGRFRTLVNELEQVDSKGYWHTGDLVLFRTGFLEADLYPRQLPPQTSASIEGVLAAPISSLYAVRVPKPYILLSISNYCSDSVRTQAGQFFDVNKFYDEEFANRLRPYHRFWYCDDGGDGNGFLACFLPWLADALGKDLVVEDYLQQSSAALLIPARAARQELGARLVKEIPALAPRVLLIHCKDDAVLPNDTQTGNVGCEDNSFQGEK